MPINDSNNERRNLTVLSLSITAFYMGDGQLGDTLSLPLLNIKFHCAEALGWLAWTVLYWFTFRYWLETKDAARDAFYKELHNRNYLIKCFDTYFQKKKTPREGAVLTSPKYNYEAPQGVVPALTVRYLWKDHVKGNTNFSFGASKVHATDYENIHLTMKRDWFALTCLAIRVMWIKPSITAYYAPYLMVAISIISAFTKDLPFYPSYWF